MKKTNVLFLAASCLVLLFAACKKDDPQKTTLQKVQAKWTFQKEYYHENYGGVESRDTTIGNGTEYADFRTDGKVYSKIDSYLDTASYSLLGDDRIIMTHISPYPFTDTASILVLNDTELQIYIKAFDPAPSYYEFTDYFTK